MGPHETEALRGPWQAVLTDDSGWVVNPADLDEEEDERFGKGEWRLAGTYDPADRLVTFDDFEELSEVRIRWVQAQAMVAGLNAGAGR